jgi:hypothetical protein
MKLDAVYCSVLLGGMAFVIGLAAPVHGADQAAPPAIASPQPETPVQQPSAPVSAPGALVIPALTVVSVEILAPLGTKLSKTGDTFPIRLAAPIVVGGRELAPAGATGMGEVVHAKKSGGSGAGGELIVAARYLDLGGHRLRLRSMKLSSRGKDQDTLTVAAAQVVSVFALAVTGKNSVIPAGTLAEAKTSDEVTLANR